MLFLLLNTDFTNFSSLFDLSSWIPQGYVQGLTPANVFHKGHCNVIKYYRYILHILHAHYWLMIGTWFALWTPRSIALCCSLTWTLGLHAASCMTAKSSLGKQSFKMCDSRITRGALSTALQYNVIPNCIFKHIYNARPPTLQIRRDVGFNSKLFLLYCWQVINDVFDTG